MERINKEQALDLYHSTGLYELAFRANELRLQHNPDPVVTYVVDRNINYTNVCVAGCRFCAFHCKPQQTESAYVLSDEQLDQKIDELVAIGGTQVLFQGGLHPDIPLSWYLHQIERLKNRYPSVNLHAFSPPEIVYFARQNKLSPKTILEELWNAGQRSMPGGGAEILVDRCRTELSPGKCSATEWLEVMEIAHNLGYKTSATMVFGHIETVAERIEHLEKLRRFQDRTGGFTAFILWPMQGFPSQNASKPSYDYLRMVALARIYLDNFAHIQASWVTMGEAIGQIALGFGADDMGGVMMEENVVSAAGCVHHTEEKRLRELIQRAGYIPKKRGTFYEDLEESHFLTSP
jgi:cyclic dehypoxanthinyl futalosine synthase